MDKKKKFRVVVVVPVLVTVLVAGLAIYFVLQVGASGGGHTGVTYSPEMGQVSDPSEMAVASSETVAEGGDEVPAIAEAECNFNEWVGQSVNEDTVKATGRPYRILGPNAMATMDFSPQRINVMIDDANIVTAVRCG